MSDWRSVPGANRRRMPDTPDDSRARQEARAVVGGALAEHDQVVGIAGADEHLLEAADEAGEQHRDGDDEPDAAGGEGARPATDEQASRVVGEWDDHVRRGSGA